MAPIKIGNWAMVGAGAVVTKNVPDFALMVGNPARQIGWVGPAGIPLKATANTIYQCPKTLAKFEQVGSNLYEIVQQ